MIIDIQSIDINNTVFSILETFKILTENDLFGILPAEKRNAAARILNNLVKSKSINKKEIDGEYYFFFFSGKKEYGYTDYLIYKQSLAFLRIMLADGDNVLSYVCNSMTPVKIAFVMNGTYYELIEIHDNQIGTLGRIIQTNDDTLTDEDKRTKDRIVLLDTTQSFTKVNFEKIKYKVHICDDDTLDFGV